MNHNRKIKLLEWDFTYFALVNSWHLVFGDLRITWADDHNMGAYNNKAEGPFLLHGWDEFERFMNNLFTTESLH